jgi:large repetitive protein
MKITSPNKYIFLFVTIFIFALYNNTFSNTFYHNGAGGLEDSSSWFDTPDFSGSNGYSPTSGDVGVIQSGITVNDSGGPIIYYALSVNGGGVLNLNNGLSISAGSGNQIEGEMNLSGGTLTIGGDITLVGGTINLTNGTVYIGSGGTSSFNLNSGNIVAGGATIELVNNATFNHTGGTFSLNSGQFSVASGAGFNINGGSFSVAGGTLYNYSPGFDITSGYLYLSSGTIDNQGSGVIEIGDGGTFDINGGLLNNTSGATITGLSDSVLRNTGGSINNGGSSYVTISCGAQFINASTFDNAGTFQYAHFDNTGTFNDSGSSTDISGSCGTTPTVNSVTSSKADGTYKAGVTIGIQVVFDQSVDVTGGTPIISLETGATDVNVSYTSGSGTNTLLFNYVVSSGNNSSDLDYTTTGALSLNGAGISGTTGGLAAALTLPSPGASGSLGANKALVIDTTVPSVSLTAPTDGATVSGASVTVSASASDTNLVGVQFKRATNTNIGSEDTTSAYSVVWDTTALSNGSHTLIAVARDSAGNYATSTSITVTVSNDAVAPTITDISSSKTNGTYTVGEVIDIDVTFSEAVTSTGNVTVTLETGTTDRTCTFSVSNSTTGTCNYTVQSGDTTSDLNVISVAGTVKDAALNTMTTPTTPTTNLSTNKAIVIDTTAPSVSLTEPSDSSLISGTSVTVSATASDTSGITNVQFKIDGATVNTDTTSTYGFVFDSTSVSSGSRTLSAVARDIAGNLATSSVTVIIDNDGPVISNVASTTAATTATVTWDTNEASDSKVSFGTVSGTYTTASSSPASVTSHSIGLAGLTSFTTYYYVVVSADAIGNISTSTEKTLKTTDVSAPTVSITAPTNGSTVSGASVSLTSDASDNDVVSSVQFKVNGGTITTDSSSPYSATWNSTGVPDGSYTLTAVATDPTGNIASSTNVTVTVDNTAPVISEISSIATATDTTPNYVFTTNEAGTITYGGSCSSVTTSATLGSNTITLSTLAVGTYADCTITVTDSAANTSSVLTITSFTINPSSSTTGGGGGGGSYTGSVSKTNVVTNNIVPVTPNTPCSSGAMFNVLTGKPCSVQVENGNVFKNEIKNPNKYKFVRNIANVGVLGNDVKQLQIFLNQNGFTVSTAGAGSIGKETRYFGKSTKKALALFQKSVGIKPSLGYFGPITRKYINGL